MDSLRSMVLLGFLRMCSPAVLRSSFGAKTVTLYAPGVGMVQRDESFAILGGVGGEDSPRQGKLSLWLTEWQVAAELGSDH